MVSNPPATVGNSGYGTRPSPRTTISESGYILSSTYSCPVSRLPVCNLPRKPRSTSRWRTCSGSMVLVDGSMMRSGSISTSTGMRKVASSGFTSRRTSSTEPIRIPLNSTGAPTVKPRTELSKYITKLSLRVNAWDSMLLSSGCKANTKSSGESSGCPSEGGVSKEMPPYSNARTDSIFRLGPSAPIVTSMPPTFQKRVLPRISWS